MVKSLNYITPMEQEKLLQLYNQFNRIHNQFSAVKRTLICTDNAEPLHPAEMQVLGVIHGHRNYSVTDIAKHLYMTKSAVSQVVKKLSGKGFVEKLRDPENERSILLSLTEMGESAVANFMGNESSALGDMIALFATFSEAESDAIAHFLHELDTMLDRKLT